MTAPRRFCVKTPFGGYTAGEVIKMSSIWQKSVTRPHFPSLKEDLETEVLIIGGASLTVYPAAGLVHYYRGRKLVVINKTELHGMGADLTISEPIGQVMAQV